jgi:PAS domain S-box-containing protein
MPARKLVNSSHLYKVVFDSIHEAVSILDTEYRILGANGAFLAELGFEESEVVGRKCFEVTHKRDLM